MGLLFRLSSHSNSSPMEGKTFQEGMNASSEEASLQEIFKLMEARGKTLKKILSHLSKIEEVFKEGEKEDEEDKVNCEQNELTQEDIDRMMTKKVRLLLPNFMPQLNITPRPWTFKRAHVNDFSESGDSGSWEDHDWPEWTLKVGTTQVTPTCFMLKCNMDPSSNDDQYLVLSQDEV